VAGVHLRHEPAGQAGLTPGAPNDGSVRAAATVWSTMTALTAARRRPGLAGIVAYGAYVPYHRLKRSEIAAVLGEGGGKGARAVASFDEDATSMGVEAARAAQRRAPGGLVPERGLFATASPPYLDKTNAAVIHAAL